MARTGKECRLKRHFAPVEHRAARDLSATDNDSAARRLLEAAPSGRLRPVHVTADGSDDTRGHRRCGPKWLAADG